MTSWPTLGIVLMATYGLAALLLAGVVAVGWHWRLQRSRTTAADLLALRLLPAIGALLLVLTVVLPAFLRYEPHRDRESIGPLLLMLAGLGVLSLGHGISRGWRACSATRALLRACGPARRCEVDSGHRLRVVDIAKPLIGVIGGWRPQVVTAESVISACSPGEFQQVIAHEAAHVAARDNLKLLLLLGAPDPLAWTSLGRALAERWRTAAEYEADQRATGNDPRKRVELAAALIKVARLCNAGREPPEALTMSVGADEVEARVRQLLAPAAIPSSRKARALVFSGLLLPFAAVPLYAPVHCLVEALVRFGL